MLTFYARFISQANVLQLFVQQNGLIYAQDKQFSFLIAQTETVLFLIRLIILKGGFGVFK